MQWRRGKGQNKVEKLW